MLEGLKQFVTINEGQEEALSNYLKGKALSPEGVKSYLDSDDGKKLLQPRLDQYFNKGLESWKQKTFPQLLEEEIQKRFPAETEEQKQLRQLKADLEAEKQARIRESLRNRAITEATSKSLPLDLVDFFVGADEEGTIQNLAKLEKVWQEAIKSAVEQKFKDSGRTPPGNPGGGGYQGNNPWKKETFNLTEQAKIYKENPELAKTLMAAAGR